MRATKIETTPLELGDDLVLNTFFNIHVDRTTEQPVHTKRHCSSNTIKAGDETCAKKGERKELRRARQASQLDEELC